MRKHLLSLSILASCLSACQPAGNTIVTVPASPEDNSKKGNQQIQSDPLLDYLLDTSYLPLKTKSFIASLSDEKPSFHKLTSNTADLIKAQEAYVSEQKKIESDLNILNSSKDGLDYLLTASAAGATIMGVTVPAAIAIEVTNKALNQALEYGIGEMEKKAQEEASKVLVEKLRSLSAKELKEFNALKHLSPDQALVKAESMVNNWISEKDLNTLPTAERAEARSIISSWTARTAIAKLAEHQSAFEIMQKDLSSDLNSAKTELLALGKSLKIFAVETRSTLRKIIKSQDVISQGLNQINSAVNKQSHKIEEVADDVVFLKTFAFSRMTAREQLAYLKKQNPNTNERGEWDKKIALLEEKINFEESYQSYFNGVQNLVTIAKNLGVNGKTVQDIADGIEKINAIKSGIESIVNQNYLSGIATLSGLLGGGDNAEAAKHRAIIARLDRVIDNQKLLSEQVQISFKIQTEMLSKLSAQIRESTEVLYLKMDKIHNDVLGNRVVLSNLMQKGLKSCEFVSTQMQEKGLQKAFLSTSNFKRHLADCSMEYDNLFRQKDYDTYFSTALYKTTLTKEIVEAEEALYADSIGYILERFKFADGYAPSILLKNPSENAFGLIKKITAEASNGLGIKTINEAQSEIEQLKHQIFTPAVLKNVQKMISILPAINIWNSRSAESFASSADLLNLKENAGFEDIALIDSALELINISLQQESLRSGDMLLPLMYEEFPQIQNEEQKCYGGSKIYARCLLQQNALLFKNFITFALYKEFYDQRFSLASYKQQLRIPNDVKGLKVLFKNNWNIQWNSTKKVYEAKVAGQTIQMPSAEEATEAKLIYSDSMSALLQLRDDLIHIKAEMNMNAVMKKNEASTIYRLFIR
ncbi:hypothetical protein QJS83_08320 [Bdellovibrio sp. 22V]|uniref:hypothetical protein n=1 Tax=Bdellovibrio TaxID=958 RepID=UPI00254271F4|nr:hypothetical protein [Bdellovibrio sp. 22V]WII73881.1 hypothetical protein QJS83_08320 [Bdellovibrio sp. 22V]